MEKGEENLPSKKRRVDDEASDDGTMKNIRKKDGDTLREEDMHSTTPVSSAVDVWGNLPQELLQMAFKQLIDQNVDDLERHKQVLLDCRLAHPRWQKGMDCMLEKKCLEWWKKANVSRRVLRSDYLFNLTHLPVLTPLLENSTMMMTKAICPPTFYDGGEIKVNPFPCNSLRVFSSQSTPVLNPNEESHRLVDLVSFFSKLGHHLTSLVLFSVNLAPDTLQGILKGTPYLQALTFDTVKIAIDFSEKPWKKEKVHENYDFKRWKSTSLLPPLSNLKHIRLFNTTLLKNDTGSDNATLLQWILTPYEGQIVSFDGDDKENNSLYGISNIYLYRLKRLSIWRFNGSKFSLPFLDLCFKPEYFLLGEYQWTRRDDLDWIQRFIACSVENLKELHLDFIRNTKGGVMLQYADMEMRHKRRWSAKNVIFLKLTAFSIIYPKFEKEVETLKDMLGCMPNLETLNFFRFRDNWEDGQVASQEEIENSRDHVEREAYWDVCNKLKKITVRLEVCDSSIFFTKRVSR